MIRPLNNFRLSLEEAKYLLSADTNDFKNLDFSGLTHVDSEVLPGDLFLAFPGAHTHGARFIESAKRNGAVAVLTDQDGAQQSLGLPTLIVPNPRESGAALAASFYRSPIRDMQSIAITGTNGKTTVTTLLYQILSMSGRESGLIGTVETRIGSEVLESKRTTPEATELQALAAAMKERHIRNLVMEVSSHSIDLNRMVGSHFAISGFTNLTQDHLDYHKSMESYFSAKSKLFTVEYSDMGFINIDDPYGIRLFESQSIPMISLARTNRKATWHYTNIEKRDKGYEFSIRGRDGILIESSTVLRGHYNLDNLLMAIAIAYECEVDPLEIARITPRLLGAAGRLEAIEAGQEFTALVDYAHTPDAVINVLKSAREFTQGRLIGILGCGGDRDSSKRPLMGQALVEGCDIAVFTSDNPRSEDPIEILNQMTEGLSFQAPSSVIEKREEAIAFAISLAKSGDTVILLGKGHESGQEIQGVVMPFDDREQIIRAIEKIS